MVNVSNIDLTYELLGTPTPPSFISHPVQSQEEPFVALHSDVPQMCPVILLHHCMSICKQSSWQPFALHRMMLLYSTHACGQSDHDTQLKALTVAVSCM